jgi:hypothetical protein
VNTGARSLPRLAVSARYRAVDRVQSHTGVAHRPRTDVCARWRSTAQSMIAWAGVHGHHQGEAGGVGIGGGGAGEGDEAVLQRLAQGFEGIAAELGQLVEEEDPVMGEADLPRTGVTTVVPRQAPPAPMRPTSEMVTICYASIVLPEPGGPTSNTHCPKRLPFWLFCFANRSPADDESRRFHRARQPGRSLPLTLRRGLTGEAVQSRVTGRDGATGRQKQFRPLAPSPTRPVARGVPHSAEHPLEEVVEVVPPFRGVVRVVVHVPDVRDVLLLQVGVHALADAEESILVATGDPEEL